jgi:hypothetical protein
MKTFIDARQIDEMLDGFEQEGWLEKSSNDDFTSLGLTDPGIAEREVILKELLLCHQRFASLQSFCQSLLNKVSMMIWHSQEDLAFTPKCGYEVTNHPFVATICSHMRGK